MNLSKAAADVLAERHRQIEAEGWTPEHDDKYQGRELVRAAISYAMSAAAARYSVFAEAPSWWPWDRSWWKPKNRRRDLVRSAALLIAEIEHIDRMIGISTIVRAESIDLTGLIEDAVRFEREQCAHAALGHSGFGDPATIEAIAEIIRARNPKRDHDEEIVHVFKDRYDALLAAEGQLAECTSWRCFHCDEVFTDRRCAADHFGAEETCEPACRVKLGAERSMLAALRRAERDAADAWAAIHNETTDAAKAYHAQASRHQEQLRAAEELGYERGLVDGRKEASVAWQHRVYDRKRGIWGPWQDGKAPPTDDERSVEERSIAKAGAIPHG